MKELKLNKDNHYLRIEQDTDYETPNDWGNEDIFLVYDHNQFKVERKGFSPTDISEYLTQCESEKDLDLRNDDYDKYWIFSVFAYIHSGVSLSLGNTDYPHTDKWDTSMRGYILVQKETIVEGKKPIIVTEKEATNYAQGLIEIWNNALSGNVHRFEVIEKVNVADDISSRLLSQFDKTKYLSKQAREFTEVMIKNELKNFFNDNIDINPIREVSIDSCGGFYGAITDDLIEHMLSHSSFDLQGKNTSE